MVRECDAWHPCCTFTRSCIEPRRRGAVESGRFHRAVSSRLSSHIRERGVSSPPYSIWPSTITICEATSTPIPALKSNAVPVTM
jgi:hypothetical protein